MRSTFRCQRNSFFGRLATAVAVLELVPHARNLIWIRICIRCTSWLTTKLVPTMGVHFTFDFERLERLVYSIGGNGDSSFDCVQKIGMGPNCQKHSRACEEFDSFKQNHWYLQDWLWGMQFLDTFQQSFDAKIKESSAAKGAARSREFFDLSNGGKVCAKIWFVERCVNLLPPRIGIQMTRYFIFDNQKLLHFSMLLSLETWVPLKRISCMHG